jgi:broad specificity phosphatase PhoE
MVKLFVVRHGETAWTRERRFSGSRDLPLTDAGHAQAEAVACRLAATPVAALYSSPLLHARETAEWIAKPHRLEVLLEPALREMEFGAWEGLTPDEVATRSPAGWAAWQDSPQALTSHGGESLAAVATRVAGIVERLRGAHHDGSVVIVSHAIVIRLMVLSALGLGPERLWSVDASPAGVTELEISRDWTTLHRMNTLVRGAGDAPAVTEPA